METADFCLSAAKDTGTPRSLRQGALMTGKLSIVVPAYNEAQCIGKNLREIIATLTEALYDFEVVVVDDGSSDGTALHAAEVAEALKQIRVIRYDSNQGKGFALAIGTRHAAGDYVAFLDADMDLHPEQLPLLIEELSLKDADAVIGSKHHPLSKVYGYPPLRRLYSIGYYFLVRMLFGLPLRDTQTGLKVFKRAVLTDALPRVLDRQFAFDLELLAHMHRLGYRLVDAPVTVHFRRQGRIDMRIVGRMLLDTLAIFLRLKFPRLRERASTAITPTPYEISALQVERDVVEETVCAIQTLTAAAFESVGTTSGST